MQAQVTRFHRRSPRDLRILPGLCPSPPCAQKQETRKLPKRMRRMKRILTKSFFSLTTDFTDYHGFKNCKSGARKLSAFLHALRFMAVDFGPWTLDSGPFFNHELHLLHEFIFLIFPRGSPYPPCFFLDDGSFDFNSEQVHTDYFSIQSAGAQFIAPIPELALILRPGSG